MGAATWTGLLVPGGAGAGAACLAWDPPRVPGHVGLLQMHNPPQEVQAPTSRIGRGSCCTINMHLLVLPRTSCATASLPAAATASSATKCGLL